MENYQLNLVEMSLKPNIKLMKAIITKGLTQAPLDKKQMLVARYARIVQRFEPYIETQAPQYLKQLEFNLNFMKMSFPKLNYTPPTQSEIDGDHLQQESSQNDPSPNSNDPSPNSKDSKTSKIDSQSFFTLENQKQYSQYVEKSIENLYDVRNQVMFLNWGAGNVDPEDIKRHKQLMKRQHFSGQFWKDKKIPENPSARFLTDLMQNHPEKRQQKIQIKENQAPIFEHDSDLMWEKVKR